MTQQPSESAPPANLCFEEALARLETIVHELEEGQIGLAEALGRYEHGIGLLKQCYGLLENAQRRIEVLTGIDASGNLTTEPFADSPSLPDSEPALSAEKAQARGQRRAKTVESRIRGNPRDVDESTGLF